MFEFPSQPLPSTSRPELLPDEMPDKEPDPWGKWFDTLENASQDHALSDLGEISEVKSSMPVERYCRHLIDELQRICNPKLESYKWAERMLFIEYFPKELQERKEELRLRFNKIVKLRWLQDSGNKRGDVDWIKSFGQVLGGSIRQSGIEAGDEWLGVFETESDKVQEKSKQETTFIDSCWKKISPEVAASLEIFMSKHFPEDLADLENRLGKENQGYSGDEITILLKDELIRIFTNIRYYQSLPETSKCKFLAPPCIQYWIRCVRSGELAEYLTANNINVDLDRVVGDLDDYEEMSDEEIHKITSGREALKRIVPSFEDSEAYKNGSKRIGVHSLGYNSGDIGSVLSGLINTEQVLQQGLLSKNLALRANIDRSAFGHSPDDPYKNGENGISAHPNSFAPYDPKWSLQFSYKKDASYRPSGDEVIIRHRVAPRDIIGPVIDESIPEQRIADYLESIFEQEQPLYLLIRTAQDIRKVVSKMDLDLLPEEEEMVDAMVAKGVEIRASQALVAHLSATEEKDHAKALSDIMAPIVHLLMPKLLKMSGLDEESTFGDFLREIGIKYSVPIIINKSNNLYWPAVSTDRVNEYFNSVEIK